MFHRQPAINAIHERMTAFHAFTSGSVSGNTHAAWAYVEKGRMNSHGDGDVVFNEVDRFEREVYVIKSWQTPIAWCFTDQPLTWYMPEAGYSKHTRNHKKIIAEGIRLMGGTVTVPTR